MISETFDYFFHRIWDSKMLRGYISGGYIKNGKRCPWVSIEHASHTAGIDEMNPVDDFIVRHMGMTHDLNLICGVLGELPESAFGGGREQLFIRIIAGAMEYSDADFVYRKIRLLG